MGKRLEEKSKKKEKKIGFPLIKSPSFRGKSRLPKSPGGKNVARSVSWDLTPNSFTPAMEEIMRKKSRTQFRRRFRHTSSDAPETKDVSQDVQESTEEDENSQANTDDVQESTEEDENSQTDTVDLISNLEEPEAESIKIINTNNVLKQEMPKIKSKNNQVSPKLALKRLYGDFSLPSLRSRRRKRSTVDACVCM